jgi:hypothetical protein
MDTSELPILLQKYLGHWKVTVKVMTLLKIPCMCHLVLIIQISLMMMISSHCHVMLFNNPNCTYFKYRKHREQIYQINDNSSQQSFYGKNLSSSDISYASSSQPFTSNMEPSPCMTIKVKIRTTVKTHLCSTDGSPEDKRRRKDIQEISLDILDDVAN